MHRNAWEAKIYLGNPGAFSSLITAMHNSGPCPAVVAPDWLPHFSPQQRGQLFDAWFAAAPAAALLPVLARCVGAGLYTLALAQLSY